MMPRMCSTLTSPQGRDEQILARAAKESRVLLTTDLDFGEIRARSAGGVSVVIVRLRSTGGRPGSIGRGSMRTRSHIRNVSTGEGSDRDDRGGAASHPPSTGRMIPVWTIR